jgi:hypothetical protein
MTIEWNRLTEHFDPADVDFKPQTFSKDGTKALAIAFVDPRRYQEKLDAVLGIANWSVEYRSLGEVTTASETTKARGAVVARLTIFDTDTGRTVVREEVGEFDGTGMAQYPTASAQAFKRACVTLGLGRYLYDLPQTWAVVENRRITDSEIARMRSQLGKLRSSAKSAQTTPPKPTQTDAEARPATGAESLSNAKAIRRISELIGDAKDIGLDFKLPKNWQALEGQALIQLGTQIASAIKEESGG